MGNTDCLEFLKFYSAGFYGTEPLKNVRNTVGSSYSGLNSLFKCWHTYLVHENLSLGADGIVLGLVG